MSDERKKKKEWRTRVRPQQYQREATTRSERGARGEKKNKPTKRLGEMRKGKQKDTKEREIRDTKGTQRE